jgi:hypothetical protein
MKVISKKMILLLIIIGSSITLSAQSSVRTLEDFSSLKVAGAFNVELIKGTSNQVEIIGVSEETLENLATEIK